MVTSRHLAQRQGDWGALQTPFWLELRRERSEDHEAWEVGEHETRERRLQGLEELSQEL